MDVLRATFVAGSVLSAVGSLLIVATNSATTGVEQLVFWLGFASLASSLVCLWAAAATTPGVWCTTQAIFLQYFQLKTWCWIATHAHWMHSQFFHATRRDLEQGGQSLMSSPRRIRRYHLLVST